MNCHYVRYLGLPATVVPVAEYAHDYGQYLWMELYNEVYRGSTMCGTLDSMLLYTEKNNNFS